MHMFKGGLTPWKSNPAWAEQVKAERLAEEAAQKKNKESGSGDIVVRVAMVLAGAGLVGMLFGNPTPPG
jgi:hypothetical protein